jgi:LAO/AO transport system kinase
MTGTPGVGKSSLIERLGLMLAGAGHRIAVLAVDPSSVRSGGSILGDKTRMEQLARTDNVFIRPSPSQAALGGVGRRTRESIALVEAWGADLVLVETVGVGQSETMVAEVTDIFVLMLAPAGGDELQGVKRGIMEMADLVLVNKADGTLAGDARRTCAEYAGALKLMRPRPGDPKGYPRALCVSARTGDGLSEAWAAIEALAAARQENGTWSKRRRAQAEASFHHALETGLIEHLDADPRIRSLRRELAAAVADGRLTPDGAAERIIHETFTPLRP